jgi:hypothetical protein
MTLWAPEPRCPDCGATAPRPPELPWRQVCGECGRRFDVLQSSAPGADGLRGPTLFEVRPDEPLSSRDPEPSAFVYRPPPNWRMEDISGGRDLRRVRFTVSPGRAASCGARDMAWFLVLGTLPSCIYWLACSERLLPWLVTAATVLYLLLYPYWRFVRWPRRIYEVRLDRYTLEARGILYPQRKPIPVDVLHAIRLTSFDHPEWGMPKPCIEIVLQEKGRLRRSILGDSLGSDRLAWLCEQLASGLALVRDQASADTRPTSPPG